ncbi:MAG: PhzF family phenazine biosynthesis protein [Elusimicrobiota bacterium]
MHKLPIYQVDAFADRPFTGNPAAVVPLHSWLPAAVMQAVAAENNLSETAFFAPEGAGYRIRWFTPTLEVDLCGHATLASAFIILTELQPGLSAVGFESRSGHLSVSRDGELFCLDFPSRPPERVAPVPGLAAALGVEVAETWQARDLIAVLASEDAVRGLQPDMAALSGIEAFSVVATAAGRSVDFVSRCFAPKEGIPEDPVTGSTHCSLAPFWAGRLGRTKLHARQLSARGGELFCELQGARVKIAGRAVKFSSGWFLIPE